MNADDTQNPTPAWAAPPRYPELHSMNLEADGLRQTCLSDLVFLERYSGWTEIGRGRYGTVVKTYCRPTDMDVALKLIPQMAGGDPSRLTGTDVTKEAADMTLTDDNFASIVAAVEEGRGVFDNIKKYLMFLLSSNIGEIGLMAGASLFGMPIPLSAVQILWVNLATDGLPALALAVDPPEPGLMRRPPRDPHRGIFTRPVVTLMLVGGLWSTLVNLGLFAWALQSGRTLEEAMTLAFVSLVLIQFFKAYNFRSDRHSILDKPFANADLLAAGLAPEAALAQVQVPPARGNLKLRFGQFRRITLTRAGDGKYLFRRADVCLLEDRPRGPGEAPVRP